MSKEIEHHHPASSSGHSLSSISQLSEKDDPLKRIRAEPYQFKGYKLRQHKSLSSSNNEKEPEPEGLKVLGG